MSISAKPVTLSNFFFLLLTLLAAPLQAQPLLDAVDAEADKVFDQVVSWRRDIHQHPELGNREVRTAKLIAKQLRQLGMEVETGIAHTGVVGLLRGGQPGPIVALRADIDALPVVEKTGLPFASKVTTTYADEEVGVMHACGHDAHIAILLGAATALTAVQEQLPGTVMFIFQPAEEGAPEGEKGGAELMLAEGIFKKQRPAAAFGLHVAPLKSGEIWVREGITAAGESSYDMSVVGRQTHGAMPWMGIDPIVLAAQIINSWQTIPSRHIDLQAAPTPVVTVGTIRGGTRSNIIPDKVDMTGTVRYYQTQQRDRIFELMEGMANGIVEPVGASNEFVIKHGYIPVVNDPALTEQVRPLLSRAADGALHEAPIGTGAEDFAFFAKEVPGVFFILGAAPQDRDPAPNHSPLFTIDEDAMRVGVRAMTNLAVGYLIDAEAKK